MSNLFSLKSIMNKPHRDGFDLSYKNAFTAQLGELLPVMNKIVHPGDTFKINLSWFTRTQPCQTAAFSRFTEYYDFFFVPYHHLWKDAPQFFAQTDADNFAGQLTDIRPSRLPNMMPYFSKPQLMTMLEQVQSKSVGADGNIPQNQAFNRNEVGCSRLAGMIKLLQYFDSGCNLDVVYNDTDHCYKLKIMHGDDVNKMASRFDVLNAMPFLAYQKIYNDFYRNSQWEAPCPRCFNADYYVSGTALNISTSDFINSLVEHVGDYYNFVPSMFDMRYANFAKDYFTGILPSKQYGDDALAKPLVTSDQLTNFTNQTIYAYDHRPTNPNTEPTEPFTILKQDNNLAPDNGINRNFELIKNAGISALAIRQAEFLQKWKEITQSGGTDYVSQMEKHFGVKPNNDLAHRCTYLGGVTKRFGIDEVVNTNITGNNQALIAGKGINVGNGETINFNSHEHGILMCIYHIGLEPEYADMYADINNTKITPTQFIIPEFDNLGMQPVHSFEFLESLGSNDQPVNKVIGYVPRYAEFKSSVDVSHGAFRSILKDWVTPIDENFKYLANNLGSETNYTMFKQSPQLLNNMFSLAADGTFATDQFLVNAQFDVKAVRNISRNGLPY